MHVIYVAQNRYFSEELVLLNQSASGRYLIKIGWAFDLLDRMQSINGTHPNKDYRYLGRGGWRFVCYRPVIAPRLRTSEKDSHRRFIDYKIPNGARDRIVGGANTGYELFLGAEDMIDRIRTEFIQRTVDCIHLRDGRTYCQSEFQQTAMPTVHYPVKPHWEG